MQIARIPCKLQKCFYRNRSRVKWLHDGDRNSSFFHASVRRRQYQNVLSSLLINGVLTDDRLIIKDHIIEFYSNLFSSDPSWVEIDFSMVEDLIPSLLTDVENAFMVTIPSTDNIHDTVFAMDVASASGADGFSGGFYQHCLEVVGSNVVLAVHNFFHTGVIFPGLNSSFIDLLPKQKDSISIGQFRLIVLSNFLFKISSKILADQVHQAFGFSSVFMDWIDCIIRSSRLSVLINGSPKGYFHCSEGVRQGDPLSPLLFGIAEYFFSRLLSRMVDFSQLLPISSPRGFSAPTHLLYAYDVLIVYRGTGQNLKNIMSAFEVYGNISGQLVNWGVPIFRGKCVLQPIADKILSKFAKWKGKAFSLADRTTLIKSVITGSFVHSFMIYKWSSSLLQDLGLLNDSLLKKLTWKFITSESFAFSFLMERYLTQLRKSHGGQGFLILSMRAHSRDGQVSCKSAYSRIIRDSPQVPWWRDVWCRFIPPSRPALTWHLLLYRLPTEDRLSKVGFHLASRCNVCGVSNESSNHLFIRCPLAAALWETVFSAFQRRITADTWNSFFSQAMSVLFSDQNGWHRIWLESDSSYVVQPLFSRSEQFTWRIRKAWEGLATMYLSDI
ncbi:hypothetical protein Ddye_009121 [Dipteronia dyeriana]|uniref:Reverse transcriptase zinc-binding domain-containing protein n=1 Tax=Dipteronia dyeriana TaxID=168575 RepID=A0AAD9XB02_9ROSI|nr:hypothetical protein Ddye_009121 [Dipteronia dyeriana]